MGTVLRKCFLIWPDLWITHHHHHHPSSHLSARCLRGKWEIPPGFPGFLLLHAAAGWPATYPCAHTEHSGRQRGYVPALRDLSPSPASGLSASLPHLPNQIWPKVDHDLGTMIIWSTWTASEEAFSSYNGEEDARSWRSPRPESWEIQERSSSIQIQELAQPELWTASLSGTLPKAQESGWKKHMVATSLQQLLVQNCWHSPHRHPISASNSPGQIWTPDFFSTSFSSSILWLHERESITFHQALHPTHWQVPLVLALKLWGLLPTACYPSPDPIVSPPDSFNHPLNKQPASRFSLQPWLLHMAPRDLSKMQTWSHLSVA